VFGEVGKLNFVQQKEHLRERFFGERAAWGRHKKDAALKAAALHLNLWRICG